MAFDNETRNRLKSFVGSARSLLTEEFTRQCQNLYGMNPTTGEINDLSRLTHLDPSAREIAQLLRTTVEHYRASSPTATTADLLDRIVREQAFTVLNRLCALRLAEAREIVIECIHRGYQSKGFQLYTRVAGGALGDTGQTYRIFLLSIFDELAVDLPVLFYRYTPQGRLFPGEQALLKLLDLINHDDLSPLWSEDETIGWIYQYFNSIEERKKMREESSAPRNSREMAVRNQFFTPRYVVEFLTDNTLGRTWFEMREGQTSIPEQCRYFVKRPVEVFLSGDKHSIFENVQPGIVAAQSGDFSQLPERVTWDDLQSLALVIDGYKEAQRLFQKDAADIANPKLEEYRSTGTWAGNSAELWICLFFEQRRYRQFGMGGPKGKEWEEIQALYHALREDLQRDTANLSQEELWQRPVYTLHRDQKDPRDLKVLDPAMGSGHFLLYAFDLLETIYREAWELPLTTPSDVTGRSLREDYPDEAGLRKAVPELILRHNLHGVDIDPRAVQIAGLALWLRAQKAWQTAGVKPAERPAIRKSNLVVAEPMPGEQDLLDDFLKDLKPALLGRLVRQVFDSMKLAGEAGTLLRVEDELQQEIEKARREWQALNKKIQAGDRRGKQDDMFTGPSPEQTELELREVELMQISGERFWRDTEERVLKLLKEYAEQAESGTGTRRRLFAEDAAKGFAFVDLCRTRFDVVVMNPPFGEFHADVENNIENNYPNSAGNILCAFIYMAQARLTPSGFASAIFDRTAIVKSSYTEFRQNIAFQEYSVSGMLDLGWEVLDANVEATSLVICRGKLSCFPVIDVRKIPKHDKAAVVERTIECFGSSKVSGNWKVARKRALMRVPNSAFAYEMPDYVQRMYANFPYLKDSGAKAHPGLQFKMDQYSRSRHEIPPKNFLQDEYLSLYNGSSFSRYLCCIDECLIWKGDGSHYLVHPSTRWNNSHRYRSVGIGYGKRGDTLDAHPLPKDTLFTIEGLGLFPDDSKELWYYLTLLNAPIISYVINLFCGQHKHAGYVDLLPAPSFDSGNPLHAAMVNTCKALVETKLELEQRNESSPYFIAIPLSFGNDKTQPAILLKDLKSEYFDLLRQQTMQVFEALGIRDSEEQEDALGKCSAHLGDKSHAEFDYFDIAEDIDAVLTELFAEELSILFGVLVGRWDIRYATSEKEPPPLPDPFDPLPVCPPGMLQRPDGLPVEKPEELPEGYPIDIPLDGILVDDPGHGRDIVARLKRVFEVIWDRKEVVSGQGSVVGEKETGHRSPTTGNSTADDRMREAAELLGQKDGDLRPWLRKDFFPFHLKRYSKSRRKAPIYWPLSTPSGAYTLWIYYHRLTDQTLLTAVNDFVEPKIDQAIQDANALRQRTDRNKKQEQELAALTDLEHELKDFREELLRIAKFWKPNLNDGVQITAAPLWKLFQHKPWQTILKDTWKKLEKGDYDWAHLAYSIWPKRVKEKCIKDKSLAIAHSLEDVYVEPPESKKKGKGRKKKVEVEMNEEGEDS